jgi:hypothetical protein
MIPTAISSPAVRPRNAPVRMPDTEGEINWRYLHIGFVDLVTGEVVEE